MLVKGRLASIDGFRAISILLVLGSHLAANSSVPFGLKKVLAQFCFGDLGVRMFFVISGFLITYLLLKEKEKNKGVNVKLFYVRRILRIFPVFYAYLFILLWLNLLISLDIPLIKIVSAALYIQNFAPWGRDWFIEHSWSLAVEEQFYIVWPLFFIRIKSLTNIWVWVSVLGLGSMMRSFHYKYPVVADYFLAPFFMHADFLFSGCFLAYIFLYKTDYLIRLIGNTSSLFVYVSIAAMWLFSKFEFHPLYDVFFIPLSGVVINVCICFLLIYFILKKESLGYKILNFHMVTFIGILSYSLYIWQQLFISHAEVWWTNYPQNILFTFLVAYMSYHLIEKPFLKLKEEFRPPIQP
jgi:peptidoglycan/LPS O-acetylase OafA/YrhL